MSNVDAFTKFLFVLYFSKALNHLIQTLLKLARQQETQKTRREVFVQRMYPMHLKKRNSGHDDQGTILHYRIYFYSIQFLITDR